ncbi:MAG TPA: toxin-antitoxin system YwqK family antitoxin [Prolixibacteraceae bacterium]|jgi:antitoxin component YwqK of YwqJK toxin-antitoxin module
MRRLIIFIFLLLSGSIIAQNTVNQVDAQGRKQGFWTKKDTGGKLLYQATFKDDKPVGEMKRFHSNGKIKAVLNFIEGSELSDVKLFDEGGHLVAQGKYIGQKKTGEWNYFLDTKVVSTENYLNGQKNGISKRFYKTGELLEESNWKDDLLNGIYRSFYQDGKVYMECKYTQGKRNGPFKTWFAEGALELDGLYASDVPDKDWLYYDRSGTLLYTLKYDKGKLLNPEVQDSIDAVQFSNYKTKGNNIPDPEKFMQNPEEYMNLIKSR